MTLPEPLHRPLRAYHGQRVLVAVSGGADSVALLRALLLAGAQPTAAHFDHQLRAGSTQDARFVQQLAQDLGVPLQLGGADVRRVAAQRGWNLEDAARRLRYNFLTRAARQASLQTILTAHTRRDQAETVLWQLLRGEAVLNGIPAERGHVRRPWLEVARPDIERLLGELGQSWQEDPSNQDQGLTRNWLRLEVLPLLSSRFPGLEARLARLATLQAQDDEALDGWAARLTSHADVGRLPLAVLRRAARQQLRVAGLEPRLEHLLQVAGGMQDRQTHHLDLPGAQSVTVTAGRLQLDTLIWPEPEFAVPDGWTLRHRQPGDRVRLPGGTRKLSDVLTDRKVPRSERDRVWLAVQEGTDGAQVQWVGLQPALWAVGARELVGAAPDPWHEAMGEALRLAHEAAARQEVPVGAVVLQGERVVGRGSNTSRADRDMTRHAELEALRQATQVVGPYLNGCTLVVTLEPCPMCLGAALEARVDRVVYGAANPRAGALGGVQDLLEFRWGHRLQVVGGVRASEARRLLRQSFQSWRAGTY
ncbi:tRNA lysidine(34) synthetase TilS [Deinococcus sonorensis]|uniref:Multifunctional fusion protein n=2 Tax=Deinococcus sonorensis TaxID=309891 RepID=A0AAU7U8X9_9DEIO